MFVLEFSHTKKTRKLHIPRAQNIMADKIARCARNQPAAMVYVDLIPSRWLFDQKSA